MLLSSILSYIYLRKIFSFIGQYLHLVFQLHPNCVCMHSIVSVKITTKIYNFENFPMNFPYFVWNMLYEISFIRKCLHFVFHLCDNCICMPIIASEIFPRKSSILSVILCNPQVYHTYVWWKPSVLSDNMSS